jgi:hypothetical protein
MTPDGRSLRWEADQRSGFFGYSPAKTKSGEKAAAQPLHFEKVDISTARDEVGNLFFLFARSRMFPNVPAFSGGLLDSWPLLYVEAFEICQQEESAVKYFLASEGYSG